MARVLLSGPLRDVAGWRERQIESPSLAAVRVVLADEDADLGAALGCKSARWPSRRAATWLRSASEVAFLPPMSGG